MVERKVYASIPGIAERIRLIDGFQLMDEPDYDTVIVYPPRRDLHKYITYPIFPVISPLEYKIRGGKDRQYGIFDEYGIPYPYTVILDNVNQALVANIEFPIVVKRTKGSGGRAVWLCNNSNKYRDVLRNFRKDEKVILQEVIPKGDRDARVVVHRGEVYAAYWRVNPYQFQTNVAQGAWIVPCDDADILRMCRNMSRNLGLRLNSWDVVRDVKTGQLYVLECQIGFGTKGIAEMGLETDLITLELKYLRDNWESVIGSIQHFTVL